MRYINFICQLYLPYVTIIYQVNSLLSSLLSLFLLFFPIFSQYLYYITISKKTYFLFFLSYPLFFFSFPIFPTLNFNPSPNFYNFVEALR